MELYDENGELTKEAFSIIDSECLSGAIGFVFGSFSIEDLKQYSWMKVMEKISLYDGKRSFRCFVRSIVRSRLINFRRDTYHRPQKPCRKCPFADAARPSGCSLYSDKNECSKFDEWARHNASKRALHHFMPYAGESPSESSLDQSDFDDLLARCMSVLNNEEQKILSDYLGGERVPKKNMRIVIDKIRLIVYEGYSERG